MVVGNRKDERKVDLDICGEKMEDIQFIKISGVNFDDNLNFRDRMYGSSSITIGGILRRLKVGGSY